MAKKSKSAKKGSKKASLKKTGIRKACDIVKMISADGQVINVSLKKGGRAAYYTSPNGVVHTGRKMGSGWGFLGKAFKFVKKNVSKAVTGVWKTAVAVSKAAEKISHGENVLKALGPVGAEILKSTPAVILTQKGADLLKSHTGIDLKKIIKEQDIYQKAAKGLKNIAQGKNILKSLTPIGKELFLMTPQGAALNAMVNIAQGKNVIQSLAPAVNTMLKKTPLGLAGKALIAHKQKEWDKAKVVLKKVGKAPKNVRKALLTGVAVAGKAAIAGTAALTARTLNADENKRANQPSSSSKPPPPAKKAKPLPPTPNRRRRRSRQTKPLPATPKPKSKPTKVKPLPPTPTSKDDKVKPVMRGRDKKTGMFPKSSSTSGAPKIMPSFMN